MSNIKIPDIKFIDLKERELNAVKRLRYDRDRLEARKSKSGRVLNEIDARELERINALLDAEGHYDPLFVNVQAAFANTEIGLVPVIFDHKKDKDGYVYGLIDVTIPAAAELTQAQKDKLEAQKDQHVARIALVMGLLERNGSPLPELRAKAGKPATVVPDTTHENMPRFIENFFATAARVAAHIDLAAKILKLLASAVNVVGDNLLPAVSASEYAAVFDKLLADGVTTNDPNLKRKVEEKFSRVQNMGDEAPIHETALTLPDLEQTTDYEVVQENISLMAPMIFASMFEELKAFQVVDRLVEMSQRGELPLVKGKAGTRLYQYWREAPNRMSETERQTFYAMTLGLPTGQPGGASNGDFQELWLRFISSVSSLVRETRVDQLLRSSLPVSINQQQVKKSARDLAANMSLHGYGMAFYAAADLTKQINEMIDLLKDDELRSAFGARDMWGVIDQVAQLELGGAKNSSKYRSLASCGAIITNWLANNTNRLKDPTVPIIDLKEVENPPRRLNGETATTNPTDYDLVNACELWLADSAMADERVEQMSQPKESPQQPSRPIQIPSIARDLLEGTGLGLGMGVNNSRPTMANGHAYGAY
jgi:hypothetical protein